ncbi:MAG: dTMP kinase [Actinomycetota bacterium]|nr:dTMP kinase [Actinomycetota bacterium]
MTLGGGRLVALEGVDGSGKSTQARILARSLGATLTFEPGATALGQAIRRLLLEPGAPAPDVRSEALLVAADRAQHVAEVVLPALDAGQLVVTDRFSGSTLAYQGYGRGLPPDELRPIVTWAARGLEADLNVVVDVPLPVARARLAQVATDRLERLDEEFFSRVREGYLALAAQDPRRWVVVDGDGDVAAVAAALRDVVVRRLEIASAERSRP